MKYVILTATDFDTLEENVAARIAQGWIPQGGVSIAYSLQGDNMPSIAQAMVLKPSSQPEVTFISELNRHIEALEAIGGTGVASSVCDARRTRDTFLNDLARKFGREGY
jgi:hypothetical protein